VVASSGKFAACEDHFLPALNGAEETNLKIESIGPLIDSFK
jgi:hypothetical protein